MEEKIINKLILRCGRVQARRIEYVSPFKLFAYILQMLN